MKNEMTEVITAFYDEDAEHGDMWWWRSGAGPFPDTEDLPTTPYARIPDTIPPADAAVVSKEDADRIAGLESEIKAYDLRMDNDAKRIAELKVERGEIILTLEAQDLSLAAKAVRIAELMELLKSARAAMNGLDHNTDDIQLMNDIDAATEETQDAN